MKVSASREALALAIKQLLPIAKNRCSFTILQNVKLSCHDGFFDVTATNLDQSMQVAVDSPSIVEEGTALVGAEHLYRVLSTMHKGTDVTIESDAKSAKLVNGDFSASIPVGDLTEYPPLDAFFEFADTFERLEAQDLSSAFSKVSKTISQDDSRPEFTGAEFYIDGKDKEFVMVSTDGHRMCLYKHEVDVGCNAIKPIIIPGPAIRCVAPCLAEGNAYIGMSANGKLLVKCGSMKFSTVLIAGTFPDFSCVIPKEHNIEVSIDKPILANGLSAIENFTDKSNVVRFGFRKDSVLLSAREAKKGECKADLRAIGEGEAHDVGMNARYVKDALSTIDGDVVLFRVVDLDSPVVVTGDQDSHLTQVIMPMQL